MSNDSFNGMAGSKVFLGREGPSARKDDFRADIEYVRVKKPKTADALSALINADGKTEEIQLEVLRQLDRAMDAKGGRFRILRTIDNEDDPRLPSDDEVAKLIEEYGKELKNGNAQIAEKIGHQIGVIGS